jgi:hypothetical protein
MRQSESSGSDFLKIHKWQSGDTDIRLLPSAKGEDEDDWFVPVGLHYNLGDKFPTYCPNVTEWANDPCPICKAVEELRQNNMQDEANDYAVRKPFYARAIVRGQEAEGVQIVRLPSTLFRPISLIVQDKDAYGDVLDPGPKGRDIRITKTGSNLDTKYTANVLPAQRSLLPGKAETLEILKGLDPVASITEVPSFADLEMKKAAIFGGSSAMGEPVVEDVTSIDDDGIVVGGGWDEDDPRDPDLAEDNTWIDDDKDEDAPSVAEFVAASRKKDIGDEIVEALDGKAVKGTSRKKKAE